METPILLINGEADNNSITFPIPSERYYNARKGHGVTPDWSPGGKSWICCQIIYPPHALGNGYPAEKIREE